MIKEIAIVLVTLVIVERVQSRITLDYELTHIQYGQNHYLTSGMHTFALTGPLTEVQGWAAFYVGGSATYMVKEDCKYEFGDFTLSKYAMNSALIKGLKETMESVMNKKAKAKVPLVKTSYVESGISRYDPNAEYGYYRADNMRIMKQGNVYSIFEAKMPNNLRQVMVFGNDMIALIYHDSAIKIMPRKCLEGTIKHYVENLLKVVEKVQSTPASPLF